MRSTGLLITHVLYDFVIIYNSVMEKIISLIYLS